MPLGAARINLISKHFAVVAEAEVIRKKRNFFAVGDAQIDTAQSKFGGSSLYLDGNDYIEHKGSGLINTDNNGTLTIEMWIRPAATQAYNGLFDASPSATGGIRQYGAGGNLVAKVQQEANGASTGTWTAGTWSHFAVTFNNGTITTYRDGVEEDTGSYTSGIEDKGAFIIGAINRGGAGYFSGHIDEFRISNNIRYTSGFSVETAPFVNDDNTICLLHFDGTDASTVFEDDNGVRAKVGVQALGNAQADTAQSKFGGSSALFDGTGDYLYISENMQIAGDGDDFTIELWIRWNSTSGSQGITSDRPPTSAGYVSPNFYLEKNSSNGFFFGYAGGGDIITSGSLVTTGVWYHLAVVRYSGSTKFYLNGTQQGGALTRTGIIGDGTLSIGAFVGLYVNGWIDEFRVSNTARYTSGFTAPTAPFVNDENTLLLLHMDGTDGSTVFTDDNGVGRSRVGVTAIGNAQIDTALSKFGGSSALFDGTGDYLQSPLASTINFGTGDFTVECWIRFASLTNGEVFISGSGTGSVFIQHISNAFRIGRAGVAFDSTTSTVTTNTNTWYHFAVSRSSGNMKIFVDGVAYFDSTNTNNYSFSTNIWIGGTSTTSQQLNGYLDEVRISDTARYTSGFTPSTTPFQNDDNTLLLLHMDGTDASTVFIDDNGVAPNHDYGA